ncbi:plasmid recombination protein [Pseudophaeobacter arcticus]|jgi:hypothetical protein|uniref:plasmid recombination protein n=1 Tax=Pseudophaeobacter arcticus TaxID=385492 RepID=UPI0039E4A60D
MSEVGQEYPVVMRMAGMWPGNIGGYEKHRARAGGDVGHVDPTRSHLNQRLLGKATWAQDVHDEISEMRMENFADELEKLGKRRRRGEAARRLAEGPRDPWRATRHGPLREIILTANKKWFEDDLTGFLGEGGPNREDQFQALAVQWLVNEFGDDCVHARADRDEEAYHIHAVVVPRTKLKDGRRMLQPSKHDVIRQYEDGQDSVGAWFAAAQIGLTRGERRKQKIRDALDHNEKVRETQRATGEDLLEDLVPVPKHQRHVSPRKWRMAQEMLLADWDIALTEREAALAQGEAGLIDRTKVVDEKEAEADAVLQVALDVAEGRFNVPVQDEDGADGAPSKKPSSPDRPHLARRLFGRALQVLGKRAQDEAKAEFAEAFDQIRAADAEIVAVAQLLPESARMRVAKARRSLTAKIMALTRTATGWWGADRNDEPEN